MRADKLSPEEKRALLKQLLGKSKAKFNKVSLSFAQERVWFIEQFQPGSSLYNIPAVIPVPGMLNVAALQQSLNEIVRRHEILRTTFSAVDGRPVQVIAPSLTLELPVIELLHLGEAERQVEAQRIAMQEAERPFDLARGPLLRAMLLRLGNMEHWLLLTMHHIVSDGWSMGVFFRELAILYEAYCTGKPSSLPELPIQYADFAQWQRQWLQGEVLEAHLSYWKRQLAGAPAILELPTDRVRPTVQTFRGATQIFAFTPSLSEAIKVLSQNEGVTLFMTLLAAFKALLFRYTGQEDIVVGSPIANRNRVELEELIGFFINTLALRTDLSGQPSFRELLKRVREVTLGAYAHQAMPFEKLVEELQPERNLGHNPLFQVMFVLQNAPMPGQSSSAATPVQTTASAPPKSPMQASAGIAKFDLTLSMVETGQGLMGAIEYSTDLFDAETISRMISHFKTLLEGITSDADQRIWALPLLTPEEREQLLVEWNATQADYPQGCLHQLFEAQVARTPGATAVVFEDEQLSYRQLNEEANQLAHYLKKCGVGPEVLVGICVERSLEMVVGLLGILKAGGAYVPLDPQYPKDRLAFMVKDAQMPVLLTQQRLVEKLPEHTAKTICLDTQWKDIAKENAANPSSEVNAENLAYVSYVPSTLNQPVGISVAHVALTRCLFSEGAFYPGSSERVAQVSSLGSDLTGLEIWNALLHGGELIVVTKEATLFPREFVTDIRLLEISTMFVSTAIFNYLASEIPWTFKFVRNVFIVGESAEPGRIAEVLRKGPPGQLYNLYGPAECAGLCSLEVITNSGAHGRKFPLGRPIANTEIYLLDAYLQPVPVGVPGEVCIGGVGLARGYLNRPELTAEKFIRHPFSEQVGARLYKTGDLARYLHDGTIEFLGRMDHQVKIRGFRVELGEIEAVLVQHPAVRESAVLLREDVPGDKRLVAYVAPNEGEHPTISQLRRFLREKVPDYMVPTVFVLLEALPLTPNGKVNRRALPAPDVARPELEESYVAPRSGFERELAGIWTEVLRLQRVGVHDNFFDLGGHSLLAAQMVSRIRKTFEIELPLRKLFESPTIAELTVAIVQTHFDDVDGEQMAPVFMELDVPSVEKHQRFTKAGSDS